MLRSLGFPSVLAAMLLIAGCGGSGPGRAEALQRSPGLAAEQELQRRAEEEARAVEPAPLAVPATPPPVIDAEALTARDASDARARMALSAALVAIVNGQQREEAPAVERPAPPQGEPAAEALARYLKARDEALAGRYTVAIVDLEKARELDPGSSTILRDLAHNYAAVGNAPRAIALFEELQRLEPDDPEASFTLALAAANRGDFPTAAALLGRLRLEGRPFVHDPAADVLADYALHVSLRSLGYDRASIEAGRAALSVALPSVEPTFYRRRLNSFVRQRPAIWQAMGDAHCRLGEYAEALNAYARSAAEWETGNVGLVARVVYVNLQLGRTFAAQRELLAALTAEAPAIGDPYVRLCGYVAAHGPQHELLTEAVADLLARHPESDGLVGAAAMLLPVDEAAEALRRFILPRAADVQLVGRLFSWLGDRHAQAAFDIAVSLVQEHGDLAEAYVRGLVSVSPRPVQAFDAMSDSLDPARAQLRARMLARLFALGEAWQSCRRSLATWPDDPGLLLLQIELAAKLDEPALLDAAFEAAAGLDTPRAWIVRAGACREMQRFDRAVDGAQEALVRAGEDEAASVDALMELARAHAGRAAALPPGEGRDAAVRRAADFAERALALAPDREGPYEILIALHGAGGALADADRLADLIRQLRAENPDSALYARLAVQDSIQRGAFEPALQLALNLQEADPGDLGSLDLALLAWQQLGRMEEAEQWLRRQLARRPGDPAILERFVRLLLSDDRIDSARELLTSRSTTGPDPVAETLLELVHRAAGEDEQAVALGERRLRARPDGPRRDLEMAALYARGDMLGKAAEHLERLAARVDAAALRHMTGAIGLTGRLGALGAERDRLAARLVQRTIEQFPEAPLSVYSAGLTSMVRLGEVDEQFDELVWRAAADAPGAEDGTLPGVLPWRDLAQRLVDAGDPAAAALALRIRLNASRQFQPEAVALLVSMAVIADAASPDGVAATLELLLELDANGAPPALPGMEGLPRLADALLAVSQMYALVGNDDGAERLLRESTRLDPEDAMAMNNLGYMRIEAGHDDAETIALIERAGEMMPDNISILDTVAWLRYKQQRFDAETDDPGALSRLDRVLTLLGDEPAPEVLAEVLDHRGDTLWRLGRGDEAAAAWGRVVELLQDEPWREQMIQNYAVLQSQVWGLLVSDPPALYHRDFGVRLERAQRKLAEAEQGGDPPVAPTFAEAARND